MPPIIMRTITLIIIHCTATPEGRDHTVTDVDRWHRLRGWRRGCGYHFLVRLDGEIQAGRPVEQPGAHCRGHNSHSIGVCYVGGLDADGRTPRDTRTPRQREALRRLVARLKARFPQAVVVGHHDLDPHKACPCFDAAKELNLC